MNIEYTGRQYETTPAIRRQIETGLEKIQKILGSEFDTHAILSAEKHRYIAEIAITVRNHPPIVGLSESADMSSAVGGALDRIDSQAVKYKTRCEKKKRQARKSEEQNKWNGHASSQEDVHAAVGLSENTAVPVLVHRYPAVAKTTDVHLVRDEDAVAARPMTLEEAIKEAHFRDRDVFVFRDPKGKVMILHRTRDGKMELIEAP